MLAQEGGYPGRMPHPDHPHPLGGQPFHQIVHRRVGVGGGQHGFAPGNQLPGQFNHRHCLPGARGPVDKHYIPGPQGPADSFPLGGIEVGVEESDFFFRQLKDRFLLAQEDPPQVNQAPRGPFPAIQSRKHALVGDVIYIQVQAQPVILRLQQEGGRIIGKGDRHRKRAAASSGEQALTLSGINGVPEGAILTTSRSLYEEGLAAGGGRVHFASYGDPYFAAVLEQVTGFELPPCVQRLTVSVPGLPGVEMVAYAVACKEKGGKRVVRLIRGWPDLQGIDILETESLSEAEVEPLQLELAHQARKEYQVCLAAEWLERENLRAGRGQELLNLLVIHNLLEARACFAGDKPLFWPVLEEVESLFQDRDVRVDDLPADVMRRVEGDLLFECHVPSVGTAAYMVVNRVLARSAITTAQQIANSLKVHKAELGVDTMLARLRREAEEKRLLL